MLPNHRFDCGPASIAISWDDDGHFVVRLRLEVRDAREEDVEELAASLDHVCTVLENDFTDELLALDWSDLLINEATVI